MPILSLCAFLPLQLASPQAADLALTRNEPNPAYPFGRRHPDAPVELEQFAFMIGEFDCVDEIRQSGGSWRRTDAIWNARYFLNGWGIQDLYWNDTFSTTNIRIFDPARGQWHVNFFRMPAASVGAGQWVGSEVGEGDERKLVMWSGSPDRRNGSRLTFYDITDRGFRWVAETLTNGRNVPGWKSTCRRRAPGTTGKLPEFMGYEPNLARPLGRPHPNAPPQLERLEFLVGTFATVREHGDDTFEGERLAHYALNGQAIQSHTFLPGRFTSTFFLFDRSASRWRAVRFRMPDYSWSVWDGTWSDDDLVLRQNTANGVPPKPAKQLRFTGIEAVQYERYLEVADDITSSAVDRRRR